MGQKVNPICYRLLGKTSWLSSWYASPAKYKDLLEKDLKIRKVFSSKKMSEFSASKIIIERTTNIPRVVIYSSKPSLLIKKKDSELAALKKKIKAEVGHEVDIGIKDVKRAELEARLVARNIANQIEKRSSYRKVIKMALQSTMSSGALGIKVQISGRLNGSEIARSETYKEGMVPLHTISADIDYSIEEALTIFGLIGVKVWIYRK